MEREKKKKNGQFTLLIMQRPPSPSSEEEGQTRTTVRWDLVGTISTLTVTWLSILVHDRKSKRITTVPRAPLVLTVTATLHYSNVQNYFSHDVARSLHDEENNKRRRRERKQ